VARRCSLEDELFLSLTDDGVGKLIDRAIELHGEELVNEHIKSASQNAQTLSAVQCDALFDISPETREILGKAARTKKTGWFKSVTSMEDVARDILGPDLANADTGFRSLVDEVFDWVKNAAD
jgi:putative ATP-dependent endonuclease of OLD family